MAASDRYVSYEGLSALAHAIRRSTAAYIAMTMTPQDGTIEDMLGNADKIASWIGGSAVVVEQQVRDYRPGPLGQPWPPEGD